MLESRLKKAGEEREDKDVWGKEEKKEKVKDDDDEEAEVGTGASSHADAAAAPSAAPAAAAAEAGGLGDLLGDLLGGSAAAAPSAVDPLSVPVTTRIGIDASLAPQVDAWFNALVCKPAGVLYEDKYVQVGVKTAFSGATGTITLFVGNKGDAPLAGFKLRVPPVPAVKAETGDVPGTVAPRAQVPVPVALESLQPFAEAPALQLSFVSAPGTGHVYPLRLPLALHNFCEPIAMGADDFKARWTALAGAPREVTAVIAPTAGAGGVSVAAAAEALSRVRMSAVEAGAPGATGASSFRTLSVGPTGAQISVGCLAMVIPAPPAFKVAVRTQHPEVSKALMAVLQHYLESV